MNNVLMLCQFFYPDKVSSAILPFELAIALEKANFNITVLCGMPRENNSKKNVEKKEKINKIEIKRCSYIQFDKDKFIGRILNYFSFAFSVILKLKNFFMKDICLVYSNPPILALIPAIFKKICGFKLVYIVFDVYPDVAVKFNVLNENSIIVKFFNLINSFVFNQCDKIIVLSSEMEEYFLEYKNTRSEQMLVIPNWYDLEEKYEPYMPRDNKITLLYGGNMGVCQEMNTILNMAERLKNNSEFEFIFAGGGNKAEFVKTYIREKKLKNCVFYDFLPKEKYEKIMKKADIYIVSLEEKAKGLGSPSKVYCYYAMGRAILAIMPTRTDVVKDIIKNECGFHISYEFQDDDFNKVVMKMKDKNLLKKMAKNARELYLEEYTREIVTNRYINILRNILN